MQYQLSNEDAIKAWLGDAFNYKLGGIFFDFGSVVKSGHDMSGGPGCWLVRTDRGVTIVDEDVALAIHNAGASVPEPASERGRVHICGMPGFAAPDEKCDGCDLYAEYVDECDRKGVKPR